MLFLVSGLASLSHGCSLRELQTRTPVCSIGQWGIELYPGHWTELPIISNSNFGPETGTVGWTGLGECGKAGCTSVAMMVLRSQGFAQTSTASGACRCHGYIRGLKLPPISTHLIHKCCQFVTLDHGRCSHSLAQGQAKLATESVLSFRGHG